MFKPLAVALGAWSGVACGTAPAKTTTAAQQPTRLATLASSPTPPAPSASARTGAMGSAASASAVSASTLAAPSASTASALPTSASAETESKIAAATSAANAWLALVDSEKYAESWSAAASLFKSAVSEASWGRAVASARTPLGRLLSRRVGSARLETSLPGAPDGQYVVIRFATRFEHKAAAIETITPMREPDGAWKVSGYFIR